MNFKKIKLYCITAYRADISYEKMVEEMCKGGADIIQFRIKDKPIEELIPIAEKLLEICKSYGKTFIINDYLDVALAINSDGIHLGQEDIDIEVARKTLGEQKIIGLSTHNVEEAIDAEKSKPDYISFGPIFPSKIKPDYPARGIEMLKAVRAKVKLPIIGIGGIDLQNLKEVISTKINGVAVISSIVFSENIYESVRAFKKILNQYGN